MIQVLPRAFSREDEASLHVGAALASTPWRPSFSITVTALNVCGCVRVRGTEAGAGTRRGARDDPRAPTEG